MSWTDTSSIIELDRHIVMLSSSCEVELKRHIVNDSSCYHHCEVELDRQWVRLTHRHAIHISMLSSTLSLEALFKGVSTRFGLRTIEKYIENLDFIFCSIFQNLRLGSINLWLWSWVRHAHHHSSKAGMVRQWIAIPIMRCRLKRQHITTGSHARSLTRLVRSNFMLPKRRFWTAEQSVACAFLKYFSRVRVLVLGYHWLKTRSKTHTQRSVRSTPNILRLGSINFYRQIVMLSSSCELETLLKFMAPKRRFWKEEQKM